MSSALLIVLVLVILFQLTEQTDLYCQGVSETGEQLEARCSYPNYKCSCINSASDPPVCHCTRIVSEEEDEEEATEPSNTEQQTVEGWNPLYVLGVGCSILMVLILTSTACCCLCRQYYSRQMSSIKPPDYSDSPPPPYPATPSVPNRTAVISRGSSSRGDIRSAASRDLFSRETTPHLTSHNIAIREAPRDNMARDLVGSRGSFRAAGDVTTPQGCQRGSVREIPLQHRSELRQINRDPSNRAPSNARDLSNRVHSNARDPSNRADSNATLVTSGDTNNPRETVFVSPRRRESIVVRNPVIDNTPIERCHLNQIENASSSRNTAVERDIGSTIGERGIRSFTAPTATTTQRSAASQNIETTSDGTYNSARMNTGIITRGLREMSSTDIPRPPFLDRVEPNNSSPVEETNRPSPSLNRGEIVSDSTTVEDRQETVSQDQIITSGPVPAIVLPSYRQGRREIRPAPEVARPAPSLFGRAGHGQNNASIMLPTYGQGLDLIIEDT